MFGLRTGPDVCYTPNLWQYSGEGWGGWVQPRPEKTAKKAENHSKEGPINITVRISGLVSNSSNLAMNMHEHFGNCLMQIAMAHISLVVAFGS